MKINEVVINEGAMWDKFKGAAKSAGTGLANAARATSDAFSYVARPASDLAAKAGYALTGQGGAGQSLAQQSQFIKLFMGKARANLSASRTSGVAPNIYAIVNNLAKTDKWDLVNSPYSANLTKALNNVNASNFSASSLKQLGALLYQIATTSDGSTVTTLTPPSQDIAPAAGPVQAAQPTSAASASQPTQQQRSPRFNTRNATDAVIKPQKRISAPVPGNAGRVSQPIPRIPPNNNLRLGR